MRAVDSATDNWLELTMPFITREHGVREVKDAISRAIMDQLDKAGMGIASTTPQLVKSRLLGPRQVSAITKACLEI